jgi:hypothetical protein
VPTLDEERDDEIRPDPERGEEPRRSPWEPSRDGADTTPPTVPTDAGVTDRTENADDGADEDFFTRLNAVPGDEPAQPEPPFVVTERDLGVGEEERAPSKAATFVAFGVVVLAVLGILMTVAAVRLFTERNEMSAALEQSVDRLAGVYAGPAASDTSKRRIAWLQRTIEDGDYAQARKAMQSLGTPEVDLPSPLDPPGLSEPGEREGPATGGPERRLPSPAEDTNLPLEAQAFFEQHPELWEAFFGFSVAIKQMERRDMPVEPLLQLRSQMVDAAASGQAQRLENLLNEARRTIEGQSGNRLPDSLQSRLEQFGQAMQQAQRQQRDVRAAVELARRSERAAQQGDVRRAERLMDQAIAAVKDAPRAPRRPSGAQAAPRGPGGMPQMGPEIGFIRFVADLATNVMQAEERDLTQIWESINIAAGAIREKNAEQIREILDDAKNAFRGIGERRRNMTAAIQQAQQQVREAREADAERGSGPGPSEAEQRERQQMVVERVAGILARVRAMPESEFEANRAEIAEAVLQAMSAPMQAPLEDRLKNLSPEERVRRKMELAGEMYLQLKERGADTDELDDTFAEVRRLIAQHQYDRAETLADEGVEMMREVARESEGYGEQLQFDGPAAGGVPATPGGEVLDHVNEGARQ